MPSLRLTLLPMALALAAATLPAADDTAPLMQAQIVLDRLGFTPGVVDGKVGLSTRNALSGFQEMQGLPVTGEFDAATKKALARWSPIPGTRMVTITADFAHGPFAPLPKDMAERAKLPALGYQTLATLTALNPGVTEYRAAQTIRVPNIADPAIAKLDNADWQRTLDALGISSEQPHAGKIVVSKARGTLKAYGDDGALLAMFTATMGSEHDPLPLGNWKVLGISHNPRFHYNPALFWDAKKGDDKATLPAGPNSPVGVVWIDLSKEHYGIHGTPEPSTIGRAESHGCVRLTNWDAARLAQMVSPKTAVEFDP
jgi:lipoprotein-anchoring transpeptidase ErfK/SrfK